MKKILSLYLLAGAGLWSASCPAADVGVTAQDDSRYCTTCHGVDGGGNVGVQAPRLAGLPAWYLKRQLENFRAGIRGSNVADDDARAMQMVAASMSDTDIADAIAWVGSWSIAPAEATVSGNVNQGRTVFQRCGVCHDVDGVGNEGLGAPPLAGQNDWYLIKQLQDFRQGNRGTHPDDHFGAQMIPMAITLPNDQAIVNVVTYINTLR